jgi:stage II sporulation protein M
MFYIIGIILGAFAVNDMNFQQREDITKYFNGFLKLLDTTGVDSLALFKMSLLDNLKTILLFWIFGFTVICIPAYYIVIGMRGFTTGFSSGIIMGVLGKKGIAISALCFLPKEIIVIPCLIILAVSGIKLSKGILKNFIIKPVKIENKIRQRIGPYSFITVFFTVLILVSTIFEIFFSVKALCILNFGTS